MSTNIALIPLNRGLVTTIDESFLPLVQSIGRRWYASKGRHTYYAVSAIADKEVKGKRIPLRMHRLILESTGLNLDGLHIDHINGDGLDNRICNLRAVTPGDNNKNRRVNPDTLSGIKGVHLHKPVYGKPVWRVRIQVDKKRLHLGCFDRLEDAAIAYNIAAIQYHGEFAQLNDLERIKSHGAN